MIPKMDTQMPEQNLMKRSSGNHNTSKARRFWMPMVPGVYIYHLDRGMTLITSLNLDN